MLHLSKVVILCFVLELRSAKLAHKWDEFPQQQLPVTVSDRCYWLHLTSHSRTNGYAPQYDGICSACVCPLDTVTIPRRPLLSGLKWL